MAAEGGELEPWQPPLSGPAPPVGGVAKAGLAEPRPTSGQGLCGTAGNLRGLGSHSNDIHGAKGAKTSLNLIVSHPPKDATAPLFLAAAG